MKKTEKTPKSTAPKAVKKAPIKKPQAAKAATPAPTKKTQIVPKANINPDFTDAFIQEVNEDVKNDNFKELWKKYGLYIVALVVLAVSAAVSFEKIKAWRAEQNQFRTESYMAAAQLQSNPENTIAALKQFEEKEGGILGDFARLQMANVLFEQQKNEEALALLSNIAADSDVQDEVRHIALIKLATYKVDTLDKPEFEELISPLLANENAWAPLAKDLLAMSAIRAGDIQGAKEIYADILKTKNLPENLKTKIQDMLSSLSGM